MKNLQLIECLLAINLQQQQQKYEGKNHLFISFWDSNGSSIGSSTVSKVIYHIIYCDLENEQIDGICSAMQLLSISSIVWSACVCV